MKPFATMPVLSLRAGAFIGLALIALVNAVTLGLVAWNRGGEPESALTLSERELRVPWRRSVRQGENSGLEFALRWRVAWVPPKEGDIDEGYESDDGTGYWNYGRQAAWLDEAKLLSLGFSPDEVTGDQVKYRRGRSRPVLLVLEFDGQATRQAIEKALRSDAYAAGLRDANPGKKEFENRAKHAAKALEEQKLRSSRLFVVDAGLDVASLRANYADRARYAIVRGQIRPGWPDAKRPRERLGFVESVEIPAIHVPHGLKDRVPPEDIRPNHLAPFTARLAFGKRLEPWIIAIDPGAASR